MTRLLYLRLALAYYSWLGYPSQFLEHYRILLNLEKAIYVALKRVRYQKFIVWFHKLIGAPRWVVGPKESRLWVYRGDLSLAYRNKALYLYVKKP